MAVRALAAAQPMVELELVAAQLMVGLAHANTY